MVQGLWGEQMAGVHVALKTKACLSCWGYTVNVSLDMKMFFSHPQEHMPHFQSKKNFDFALSLIKCSGQAHASSVL